MLAYLVMLYDPAPPPFIGIEEPENLLHPRLLPELAEECRAATARTQLLVTTHSPHGRGAVDGGVPARAAAGMLPQGRSFEVHAFQAGVIHPAPADGLLLEFKKSTAEKASCLSHALCLRQRPRPTPTSRR